MDTYNLYEVGFADPIFSGSSRQFLFRRLTPNSEYQLILEACTGPNLCTRSQPMSLWTAETAPEVQPTPVIQFSNATAILVTWTRPLRANGKIISYQVIRKIVPQMQVDFDLLPQISFKILL